MLLREHAHGIGLHVNLCGAVRLETLFELSKRRNALSTPATLPEFSEKLIPKAPYSLKKFTDLLEIITPLISGKKEDLARVCNEFVEDCVKLGGLCYVETRFCPFTLTGRDFNAEEVLKTILDSFERSSKKYNTEVRSILTIMGNAPKTAKRTLNLAKRYQTHGVVAIDVVGDDSVFGKESLAQEIVETFGQAKYYGIHRTINVGDYTSAHSIYNAVITLHPERIGHGHRILDNNDLYNYVVNENVHFELCPSSSVITGAVNSKSSEKHPIHRFIEDNVNFSINAGDPTLTQKWNLDEAKYCLRELGLKQTQLNKVNINAAKAAFIIPEERTLLLSHLKSRTRNRIIKI